MAEGLQTLLVACHPRGHGQSWGWGPSPAHPGFYPVGDIPLGAGTWLPALGDFNWGWGGGSGAAYDALGGTPLSPGCHPCTTHPPSPSHSKAVVSTQLPLPPRDLG